MVNGWVRWRSRPSSSRTVENFNLALAVTAKVASYRTASSGIEKAASYWRDTEFNRKRRST